MELQFLSDVPLFKNLTKSELRILEKNMKLQKYKNGESIIREDETSSNLFVLYKGNVRITKKLSMLHQQEERDKTFTILSAENHSAFGEISFLGKVQKRTATVIAQTDCQLYSLSKKDFLEIAGENPQIGYKVIMEIACNLSILLEKTDSDILKLTTALIFALS